MYPPIRWDEFTPGKSVAASGHSLPVDYELEGILLADVEVGSPVHVARHVPSGAIRIFASSPVTSISSVARGELTAELLTANSSYRVEAASELAEFAPLAEILLREIQDP